MSWEIKDYKTTDTGGAIAGRFTLVVGPMEIRGWTHLRGNDGDWVSGPQREYEKDGERKFYSLVYFSSKEKWAKFQKWALVEIKKLAPATTAPDPVPGGDIPF
jgi:hypothetical protein